MIRFQTFLYSRFLVIIPLVEGSAAFVTDIFLFGGIEGDMEGCATALQMRRPVTRLTRSASGTAMFTAASSSILRSFRMSSRAAACSFVRGNPSRMNPLTQSGWLRRSRTIPMVLRRAPVRRRPYISWLPCPVPFHFSQPHGTYLPWKYGELGSRQLIFLLGFLPAPGGPIKEYAYFLSYS